MPATARKPKKKTRAVSTKPKKKVTQAERKEFFCCKCGKSYPALRTNFPYVHSAMYEGNESYAPICLDCMDEMYRHYRRTLGNELEAAERICMKLDIYWRPRIFTTIGNVPDGPGSSKMRAYLQKAHLAAYKDKTYDDTLDEEYAGMLEREVRLQSKDAGEISELAKEEGVEIPPEVIEFWGTGFEPSFYIELDRKYKQWTSGLGKELDRGEEAIYKQICILETTINRDSAAGKSIEKNVNALNSLLGSANIKPSQKKSEEEATAIDGVPFGVGIKIYENTRPIPKPDPDLQDVDGIVRYISVWFLGHLCKMLGIKNTYCKLYEEELEKMRIDKPDLDDEDDETLFNNIFSEDGE